MYTFAMVLWQAGEPLPIAVDAEIECEAGEPGSLGIQPTRSVHISEVRLHGAPITITDEERDTLEAQIEKIL